ncbi:CHAT domain-containing protein [Mesobacterium pallidum]|uniref:CHAT domain-containing protein n=1 Tax=Mesobacterium pallidum TaxID=2872037 RepID=UPI001EE2D981|nr:CHAT domain-containing protein [Mesobacterium pallidum]
MRRTLLLVLSLMLTAPQSRAEEAEALAGRAFEGAQWVLATQAARAVAQVGVRAAAGDGPLGTRIRARQAAEADLARLTRALADPGANADSTRAEIRRLSDEVEALDAEIRRDFPDYAEMASPRPLSYAEVQALLAPGEALLLILSSNAATYVWAVSPDATAWHRSDMGAAEVEAAVRALRADLDPTGPSRGAAALEDDTPAEAAFDTGTAHALYAALIAPVAGALGGADSLFVVKDGPLSSLPLSVLLTAPHNGPLAEAPWLARRYATTTLPAVASLGSIRAGIAAAPRVPRFAGFGDPVFGGAEAPLQVASRSIGDFFGDTGTQLDAIRQLPSLPGTARELRRIAQLFPGAAELRLGPEASEASVKAADLTGVTVLSFATHGLITGDISGLAEPALAFTPPKVACAADDGLLTASEASALTLDADWVILSACNTAAGDGTPGAEGLSGLARAFLFAGARAILVSHWPVRDDVAARLTADTLARLAEDPGLGRAEALRRATLALMADGVDPSLAHPSAWAPFVVVGEGGAPRGG